jgi:hypothetical protein
VFHYDLRDQGMLSFDMFLHSFEKMIIETLSVRNQEALEKTKKPLITEKDLLTKVLFRFYDETLFEQDLSRCLVKATSPYSMTAAFQIQSNDDKAKLKAHLDRYRNKEYKETPLLDKFEEIVGLVANSYQGDRFHALLLIVYDVLMRKEQERKPPELTHTSANRDGLDVLNFFMDLINHIAGYTDKYYEEI